MKCFRIFILIPCLALVSLISACDRLNSQIAQVDDAKSLVNSQNVDFAPDQESCLDDEHAINLSTSPSKPRLGTITVLSCPIKY